MDSTWPCEWGSPLAGDARDRYLTLALVPGIGAARLRALLATFQTADGALAAPFELLRTVPGMSAAAATAVRETSRDVGARARIATEQLGGQVLCPGDPGFPDGLVEIAEPPTALFLLGRLDCLARQAVAIVGSRDHSGYGAAVTAALARGAAAAGLVVVSGMARGLDAVAHTATLEAPRERP